MALPAWVAWMVQVPALTSVTLPPETVQTGKVVDVNATVRPDVAVALRGMGAVPIIWFVSVPKAMVWTCGVTLKLWLTAGAAA